MSTNNPAPARPALQDASNRVNQTPILPPPDLMMLMKKAAGQPLPLSAPAAAPKAAPKAASSRKRKSETSLDDDIATYKQNLDHIETEDMEIDLTCNQVRGRINKLLDSGIMKKGEFCKTIGCNPNSVNTFLGKRGSMDGAGSNVYINAWSWLKQREIAGLKMPDVKKRQKTEAAAAPAPNPNTGRTNASNVGVTSAPATDISNIHLDGEETDSVPVYDTCDEIRKKISAHLRTPGLTAAQFCRDIYAQLHQPKVKLFQSKQLNDFRGKKGPNAGCTSKVFYAAYVYFEKKRIAEGKPKSQHRLKMEEIWARDGGFDLENDGRSGVIVFAGEIPSYDQYGQLHIN
ncbi:hypothetical protein F5Y04DRAFT_252197 [Hypomontagnella monticulosa]|nr:hypothetical protein F5Y04DRAFT_252197 [Hypomontagnella monticulosa]